MLRDRIAPSAICHLPKALRISTVRWRHDAIFRSSFASSARSSFERNSARSLRWAEPLSALSPERRSSLAIRRNFDARSSFVVWIFRILVHRISSRRDVATWVVRLSRCKGRKVRFETRVLCKEILAHNKRNKITCSCQGKRCDKQPIPSYFLSFFLSLFFFFSRYNSSVFQINWRACIPSVSTFRSSSSSSLWWRSRLRVNTWYMAGARVRARARTLYRKQRDKSLTDNDSRVYWSIRR